MKKGKEYDRDGDGHIRFEGEYLNGKKWNVKFYDFLGKIESEIKLGKGRGKEYNDLNSLIYDGEYLEGEKNGKGKEYDYGYLYYEGEYLKGEKNGKGKEYDYKGNLKYEGEYLKGKRNGKGREYNYRGYYEVEYLNGKKIEKEKQKQNNNNSQKLKGITSRYAKRKHF